MTIQNANKRIAYAGNGSTLPFAYNYRILDEDDLTVVLQNSAGVDTIQTITTHYTVSGVGDAGGGTVTMVTPPAIGETLTIILDPDITQLTDYTTGGAFPAESHEAALDNLTNITKRTRDLIERSLTLGDGDTDGSGDYEAGGNRINSLGVPVESSDAATRGWVLTQIVTGATVDYTQWPDSYSGTYVSASVVKVSSQPTDFFSNKVLHVGRRVFVSGSALGDKAASITAVSESAGNTDCTVVFDDGSTLSNEAMTVYVGIVGAQSSANSRLLESGDGFTFAKGTQGGAALGQAVSMTVTPGTDQHFSFAAKVFSGTRTDTGSAAGNDHCVGGYFEAQRGAGSSDGVWGLNSITEVYNLSGATIGFEIDINNFSTVDPGLAPAQAFLGLSLVNGANYRGGTAIAIARNGSYSNNEWNRGLHIKDTLLRGVEFTNCGNATGVFSDTVLKIKSLGDATTPAALQVLPFDDDNPSTEILFYATNAADSNVTAYMTKRGGWHLGGPDAALLGMLNAKQQANGEDSIVVQRFTDTSPTGYMTRLVNAANSVALYKVGVDGRAYIGVPDAAPTDGNIDPSMVSMYLDESGNTLNFRVRYAGGTLKVGTVALT